MNHLRSLGLGSEGRSVLDAGCSVGHLARHLAGWGCRVVCADGRVENIAALRSRYPNLESHVLNVETDFLRRLGGFEVVICYGLLYHLESPLAGLRNMAGVCEDLLLLETLVCDHTGPVVALTDELNMNWNQSLGSFGCRPSPA